MLINLYLLLSNYKDNEIKDLMLDNNCITDASILSRISFPKLEMLDLSLNKIKNLNFLNEMDSPNLILIFLNDNLLYNLNPILSFIEKHNMKIISLQNNNFVKGMNKNKKHNETDGDEIAQNNDLVLDALNEKKIRIEEELKELKNDKNDKKDKNCCTII